MKLSQPYTNEFTIEKFYGYNHNLRVGYGGFYDMQNLTSSYFPMLSTRHKRADFSVSGKVEGLFSKEKIAYINNNTLYYGGTAVAGMSFPDLQTERKLVSMGAYLLIFPDKKYLNTDNTSIFGDIEATFTTAGEVTYTLSDVNGTDYTYLTTKPEEPEDGDYWLDGSTFKIYSEYSSSWVSVLSTYVKISYPNIGKAFSQYDGVKISGSSDSQFNTTTVLWAVADDYIVVTGIIDGTFTQNTALTIKREVPDMDFLCEGENRVWGCNSSNNEIYACKLGDFKNWNCFMGISTDSYAASVGTDGDFTGAIRYLSSVLFFKENCIHKIYNTNPPYNISSSFAKGVQKGSSRSLCVVNGSLFYLSPTGIVVYEGSLSSPVENVFGTTYYFNGVAGEFRDKYYICVSSGTNTKTLFVYDTKTRMWHKEDNINISEFATNDSNLYFIYDDNGTKKLGLIDSEQPYGSFTGQLRGYNPENSVAWYAETGLIGLDYVGHKYIKIISTRLKLDGNIVLYAEYDSSGVWEVVDKIETTKLHGVVLKTSIPQRCDHLRLRFTGNGICNIYSLTISIEEGSE